MLQAVGSRSGRGSLGDTSLAAQTTPPVFVCGADEGFEKRMRSQGARVEFRVELAAEKTGVIRNFHHFHIGAVGRCACNAEPVGNEGLLIFAIELVTVAMALGNLKRSIGAMSERAGF